MSPTVLRRTLVEVRGLLAKDADGNRRVFALIADLDRALEVSTKRRAFKAKSRAEKKSKRAEKAEGTAAIRAAVVTRCSGMCECGCGSPLWSGGELDHFFSRRHGQSVESTWLITAACHRRKTDNRPSAAYWLRLFIHHCERHGYLAEATKAKARLEFVETRTGLALGQVAR